MGVEKRDNGCLGHGGKGAAPSCTGGHMSGGRGNWAAFANHTKKNREAYDLDYRV